MTITVSVVIVTVLVVFLLTAHRQMMMSLLSTGDERAQTVAGQIADLLERNIRQNRDDLRQLVTGPEVHAIVEHPDDTQAADALRNRLSRVPMMGSRRVEVWNDAGSRLFEFVRTGAGLASADTLPRASRPITPGLSPLLTAGDMVFYELVEEIRDTSSADAARQGFLIIRSSVAASPRGAVVRLVGPESAIMIGNRTGDVWTDLSRVVPPPPIDLARPGPASYTASDGDIRIGALAAIPETPYAVWVEFPRAAVIRPVIVFRRRMVLMGTLVVLVAAFVVRGVTRRMTTPLLDLTRAAEAIAAGDYAQRTPSTTRRDEIGRLGAAFNVMAEHVQAGHQRLERQVRERTDALEALRSSEARYRAIVDVAFDSFITIDSGGIVRDFNPAAELTFGYRRQDAVGRPLAELIIPERLREAHRQGLRRFLETGAGPMVGKLVEMEAMRADGREFPAEIAITEIESAGSARMFTGVVRDITARRIAETALVESERAFRSTFDDAPLGIAQVSVEGRWIRVNHHLTSILGWDADEICGRNFLDIFHPDDRGGVDITASRPDGREDRVQRKDGQFVWVRLTISPIRNGTGEARHFVVILEDVSERRRLEERLRESEKLEAIGRLAGGVAHDFNNLLTAILGYAQLLSDSLDHDDPKHSDLDEIIKAAERSAALTGQLLAFSRKQVLSPMILDLNELVTATSVLLRRVIGEHIEVVTRLASDVEAVSADRTQLEQIVINLAVNARDAMPSGGRLTIETANVDIDKSSITHTAVSDPGRYVMLSVSDTGIGMDADTRLRVFEPFFTTKEQGRGTGLGLATVYGIVKQSGGFIGVYSEPGEGATFRVYLPAVPGAKAELSRRDRTPAKKAGHETIVVVEDERAVRLMTRMILERAGYQVVEAATPHDAVALVTSRTTPVDLMISDVVMPGAHGPALFKQLSSDHPSMKVLYMSGYTDEEIMHAGRLEPGSTFIEKPFTSHKLLEKVREILDA